jgi:hypothetical protein
MIAEKKQADAIIKTVNTSERRYCSKALAREARQIGHRGER